MSRMDGVTRFGVGWPGGVNATATVDAAGNKAWHLVRMAAAGFPVPPGFVLGTGFSRQVIDHGGLPDDLIDLLAAEVRGLEEATGATFGGDRRPLLVSVRSGAAVSMPGMLETVLNVGLGPDARSGLIRSTGYPRLFSDCQARLVRSYAETVAGLPAIDLDRTAASVMARHGVRHEAELDTRGCDDLAAAFRARYRDATGTEFPDDPMEQLVGAVEAVFRSWRSTRAVTYRRLHGLDDAGGTAVIVQAMVFGNRGADSGSGVAFSRNPATGEPELYLDYLADAQGEEVVSGRRSAFGVAELGITAPGLLDELTDTATRLEREFGDAQDFEFTVEAGRLWLLQTRAAKRTAWAALRIAVDLAAEGIIDRRVALDRLAHRDVAAISRTRLTPGSARPLATAIPAGPGVAMGPIALTARAATASAAAGAPAILVRPDTSTEDLAGMATAAGILTRVGSRTSHAAVVARQLDRTCLVGCDALEVDDDSGHCRLAGIELREGDIITLDGDHGAVYLGSVPTVTERPTDLLARLDELRHEPVTTA